MTNNQKLYLGLGVAAVLLYVYRDKIFGKKSAISASQVVANPEPDKDKECEEKYKEYVRNSPIRYIIAPKEEVVQREKETFIKKCKAGAK